MVRLSQTTLSLALLGMVLLASIDTFFGPLNGPGFTYKNILVYLIILSLAPYVMKETRVEKKKAVSGMFLVMSFAFISVNQYIFSLHKYELLPASAAMLAAAFAFMAFCCRTAAVDKKNGAVTVSPVEFMGLAAVLVFALAVRLYRFDSIPPGIWFDEAVNGNETLRLLYGSEPPPVFIERLTMMPAMFFYITSAFMKFFGENIYAMRYVSVFAGVLSVAAFYFLARRVLHDHALALCAAFLPASS
ncbi:MAG: glycosyltransferase family 39 protein, partial [Spirochaetia bacterium]|nr:glycosyltransferase family 39 protein [Spirochaetia bacterium]